MIKPSVSYMTKDQVAWLLRGRDIKVPGKGEKVYIAYPNGGSTEIHPHPTKKSTEGKALYVIINRQGRDGQFWSGGE